MDAVCCVMEWDDPRWRWCGWGYSGGLSVCTARKLWVSRPRFRPSQTLENILNPLRPSQNGRHLSDDILKCILLKLMAWRIYASLGHRRNICLRNSSFPVWSKDSWVALATLARGVYGRTIANGPGSSVGMFSPLKLDLAFAITQ